MAYNLKHLIVEQNWLEFGPYGRELHTLRDIVDFVMSMSFWDHSVHHSACDSNTGGRTKRTEIWNITIRGISNLECSMSFLGHFGALVSNLVLYNICVFKHTTAIKHHVEAHGSLVYPLLLKWRHSYRAYLCRLGHTWPYRGRHDRWEVVLRYSSTQVCSRGPGG